MPPPLPQGGVLFSICRRTIFLFYRFFISKTPVFSIFEIKVIKPFDRSSKQRQKIVLLGFLTPFFRIMKEIILLTRAEVAGILKLKPRTVSKLKGLAPIRINSRLLRYRRDDVELWLGQFPGGESNTVDDQRARELITIIEESNNPDAVESAKASLFSEKGV